MTAYNRFSEFAEESTPLDGKKIAIDDILNKDIVVKGATVKASKFERPNTSNCATVQIELDGEIRVFFTGSSVLISQCERYKDKMPFVAQIKKVNKYYTFS